MCNVIVRSVHVCILCLGSARARQLRETQCFSQTPTFSHNFGGKSCRWRKEQHREILLLLPDECGGVAGLATVRGALDETSTKHMTSVYTFGRGHRRACSHTSAGRAPTVPVVPEHDCVGAGSGTNVGTVLATDMTLLMTGFGHGAATVGGAAAVEAAMSFGTSRPAGTEPRVLDVPFLTTLSLTYPVFFCLAEFSARATSSGPSCCTVGAYRTVNLFKFPRGPSSTGCWRPSWRKRDRHRTLAILSSLLPVGTDAPAAFGADENDDSGRGGCKTARVPQEESNRGIKSEKAIVWLMIHLNIRQ